MRKLNLLFFGFVIATAVYMVACSGTTRPAVQETPPPPVQKTPFVPTLQREDNARAQEFAKRISPRISKNSSTWFELKEDFKLDPKTFFIEYADVFGLGEHDEMRLVKEMEGRYHYEQYYKGIEAGGAHYTVVVDGVSSGRIIEGLDINPIPTITLDEAIQIALDSIKLPPAWKDKNDELYPVGFIEILKKKIHPVEGKYYDLNYDFYITVTPKVPQYMASVNAHTGEITHLQSTEIHNCTPSMVNTHYNGIQNFDVWKTNSSSLYKLLIEDCRGDYMIVKEDADWNNPGCAIDACIFYDTSNTTNWDDAPEERRASSALWAAQYSWDYFNSNHSLSGTQKLKIHTDVPGVFGASFAPEAFIPGTSNADPSTPGVLRLPEDGTSDTEAPSYFPDGISWQDAVSLESIAHEFTHNIDIYDGKGLARGNNASLEMQTITESISDMFAALISIEKDGLTAYDWELFDDEVDEQAEPLNSYRVRSMANPNTKGYNYDVPAFISTGTRIITVGQPDFYEQADKWFLYPDNTSGFFHPDPYPNTGVLNHWFYLLAQGGTNEVWIDDNDNFIQDLAEVSTTYSAVAIPISHIENILFRLFTDAENTNGLAEGDNFFDFARKVVIKTKALYPNDEHTRCNVFKAFNAVNLQPDCLMDVGIPGRFHTTPANLSVNVKGGCDCLTYVWERRHSLNNTWTPMPNSNQPTMENLPTGTYRVRVTSDCLENCTGISSEVTVQSRIDTGGGGGGPYIPDWGFRFLLNPFRNSNTIQLEVPETATLSLWVADMQGNTMATLIDEQVYEKGEYNLPFDGTSLSPGSYVATLRTQEGVLSKIMIKIE